jgi:hypothetical protein
MTSTLKLLLIFSIGHALICSCNVSSKIDYTIPDMLLKDTITIDTTFLFEASGTFYIEDDMLYTGPVALIKPDFTITGRNYHSYKSSTVNFLFGGNGVEYQILKSKFVTNSYSDSLEYKLKEQLPAKEMIINNGYKLLERKIKLKCFKIGSKNNENIIDPLRNKPVKSKKVTYYGVYAIEY